MFRLPISGFAAAGFRLITIWLAASIASSGAAALEAVADFGENPGELDMFVYRPSEHVAGLPLVVALHGCAQQAQDFDAETGLIALANEVPFVLVLPQQRTSNNPKRCFNWFQESDNRPGQGESASLKAMIETALARYQLDGSQVYILGLSAGGSMSAVMLADYPDLFAGGGIIAGTPFDCNRGSGFTWGLWLWYRTFFGDAASASFSCGLLGYTATNRTASDWGDSVRAVTDAPPSRWPRVSIWTGTADQTVDPANRQELVEQWTNVHGIDAHSDLEVRIGPVTRMVFEDPAGAEIVESWQVDGFPHAFPIDPEACGHPGPFIVDADLCAARRIAQFWGLLE